MQANQELATANEELRGGNEELLVGQEEAQAAMEEIETLNEEQQASNEELETLNEELQATVEELNATNEDLQARTNELLGQAGELVAQREESEEGRRRLRDVLQQAPSGIVIVRGPRQALELVNATAQGLLGRDEPELLGLPLLEAVPELAGQELVARIERVALTGEGSVGAMVPVRLRRGEPAAEEELFWEVVCQPLTSTTSGEVDGVLVHLVDRTAQVVSGRRADELQVMEQAERSQRQLQEEFLALASHELRTPLTALRGALQLLVRGMPEESTNPQVRRYAEIGLAQAQLLSELVGDLADVIRLQGGTLRIDQAPVDLRSLVTETVELARPMLGDQVLRAEVPDEPIMLEGDARRLRQILLNLLSNAGQHAPGTAFVDLALTRVGETAVLRVRDYGPGIPAADRERVFSRFYQVERGSAKGERGLGLGLFITRELVLAHRGSIEAQAAKGGGTAFVVRLPLLRREGEERDAGP
jgi:two-component system CheB/CheR fusion protein